MENNSQKGPGTSADVPGGVPEPDQIASGRDRAGKENTIAGISADTILYLCERDDRIQDLLSRRIDRLNRRIAALEERREYE